MFAAGAAIEGLGADAIIAQDQKIYQEAEMRFSLSQMETVGFHGVLERKKEIMEQLQRIVQRDSLAFACLMATDITRETSLCLFQGDRRILSLVSYPAMEEGIFEMKGVLSRKKQILPYFIDLLMKL
jgi:manganese-dependent inorganic pyrophosphatase